MCKQKKHWFFIVILIIIFVIQLVHGIEINETKSRNSSIITELNNTLPRANLSILFNEVTYTNIEYTKLFRIDNLLYPLQKINVIVNYNVSGKNYSKHDYFVANEVNKYKTSNTGNLLFENSGNYTLCGWINNSKYMTCKNFTVIDLYTIECDLNLMLDISKNSKNGNYSYYQDTDKLKLNFDVNSTLPFTIEYWINDVFEAEIKQKLNTSLPKKQYTINTDKEIDILFIKAVLYPKCNDTNLSNNNISKQLIVVNHKNSSNPINSDFEFIRVYNEKKLKFGGDIRVKAKILKINSSKNLLQAYVVDKNNKKVSETTKISLFGKNVMQDLLLYIKLKEKCVSSKSSKYYLVMEGFDIEVKKTISIDCDEKKNAKSKNEEKKKITKQKNIAHEMQSINNKKDSRGNITLNLQKSMGNESLYSNQLNNSQDELDFGSFCNVSGKIIYQNKNPKIRFMIPFFLGLLLLLNLVVILLKKS